MSEIARCAWLAEAAHSPDVSTEAAHSPDVSTEAKKVDMWQKCEARFDGGRTLDCEVFPSKYAHPHCAICGRHHKAGRDPNLCRGEMGLLSDIGRYPRDYKCPNCGCVQEFNADHEASCPHVNLRFCSPERLPGAIIEAARRQFEHLERRIADLERAAKQRGPF